MERGNGIILIGEADTKRTLYLKKAAAAEGVSIEVIGWDTLFHGFDLELLRGRAVKIDPPSFETVRLSCMHRHLEDYRHALHRLAQAECFFLNEPEAVCSLLDKRQTKRQLQERGVAATQMFAEEPQTAEQLIEVMERRRCYSVFVKPGYFSGAAGVAAVRLHPLRGRMRLYTSCLYREGELINTKKLFCLDSREEICRLLDRLLTLGCVVERWHPKAVSGGKSYDLRVVYQFGRVACMVARQAKGPITNLHLNNQALEIRALGLEEHTIEEIAELCRQALTVFSGLSMAGVDILLERETLRPLVIEMNGQGDLIYQDIYGENKIYREQIRQLGRAGSEETWCNG